MLECNDVRLLLADYEAGNLPEERAQQVAEHLLLCPICAAELETLRRENDRLAEAAPSPAAPRSLGTQAPASVETPVPAEETEEPEVRAPVTGQITEIAPLRKLRRRGKVLIGLALLLVLVGICAGVLYHFEAFSIRDWAKSKDGKYIALIYKGTEEGEDGFRLRLWDKKAGKWQETQQFSEESYCQMAWSPDSAYLALESAGAEELHQIRLINLSNGKQISIYNRIKSEMNNAFGYLGKIQLERVPSCRILAWTADSNALLMWAEGNEEPIDGDYGIELADSGAADGFVSGILLYDVNTYEINVVQGFGVVSAGTQEKRNNILQNRFNEYMMKPGAAFTQRDRNTYFGEEALIQLLRVVNNGDKLHVYYDLGSSTVDGDTFLHGATDLSVLDQLESSADVMLILARERQGTAPAQEAYLVLPYLGAAS